MEPELTELKCYGSEEEVELVENGKTKKIKIDGPCVTKHGGKTADAAGDQISSRMDRRIFPSASICVHLHPSASIGVPLRLSATIRVHQRPYDSIRVCVRPLVRPSVLPLFRR